MTKYTAKVLVEKAASLNYGRLLGKVHDYKQCRIALKEGRKEVRIFLEADDLPSLRAAFNALTKDIDTIEKASAIK